MKMFKTAYLYGVTGLALAVGIVTSAKAEQSKLMRYPDIAGDQIGFVYADKLWVSDLNGKSVRKIDVPGSELSRVRFSPDGKQIAYTAKVDGNADIYIVPLDGSAPARRLTHHPAQDLVLDWRPDGGAILFASTMTSPRATYNQLHTVDVAGGLPVQLPLPYGETATYSPDGESLLFTYQRDFQEEAWKRYYGGRAPDLWRYDFASKTTTKLTSHEASDSMPMIIAGQVYFLSERDQAGRSNLWRLGTEGKADSAVTSYTDTDVRRPSTDGKKIIFEVNGDLATFDPATGKQQVLAISIDRPAITATAAEIAVDERLTSAALSPDGVTIEARGDIFNYKTKDRVGRNVSKTSDAAERFPRANSKGDIAYVSDADGEYNLYIRPAGGGDPRKLAEFGPGLRYNPFWSPDDKFIAIYDHEQTLWVIDAATGAKRRIDQGKWGYHQDIVETTISWSSDSRWLAYARGLDNRNNAIFIHDVAQAKTHQLTSGAFNDYAPTFAPGNNYLLLLSHRRFNPTFGDLAFDATWTYTNGTVAAIIPLRAGVGAPGDAGWKQPASQPVTEIDFDGAEQRLRVLPAPAGMLSALRALDTGYVVLRQSADRDVPARIEYFAYAANKAKLLQASKGLTLVDSSGAKLLTRAENQLFVIDAHKSKAKPVAVDMATLKATPNTALEARQMFNDAWRYGRDFYYDPKMHGVDWQLVRKRFEPLVPYVTNDDDLTFIVREMMGELNGGHVYASATAPRSRGDASNVGLLGIDFAVDAGKYRIEKIYRTGSRGFDVRSPLDDTALNVREGDYIVAVNGAPISVATDPWGPFVGLAGKEVELSIERPGQSTRLIRVKTLSSERKLRELAWVEDNRRKVDAASNGRLGYVYVPNTGAEGQNELMIQYRSQFNKPGLLIDERFNTGGALGDRMVELLNRPPLVYFRARNSSDYPLPELAHRGPKAMLINGWSYSGGDGFPLLFKTAKVGKLIGTRTWGGLIGPGLSLPLINGGFISPAPQRVYTTDGRWAEGNEGVRPNIVVDNDPGALARGHDQQLEAGIAYLMEQLKGEKPIVVPEFQGAHDWNPQNRKEK